MGEGHYDATYQVFSEWMALHVPSLQDNDNVPEQFWKAITTLRLEFSSVEGQDSVDTVEVPFEDLVLSPQGQRNGMMSIHQDGRKAPLMRLLAFQAAASASLPMKHGLNVRTHEQSESDNILGVTFRSTKGLFRITGLLTGSDVKRLRNESLEASLASLLNGTVDEYAQKHCNCFKDWMCELTAISISKRLLLSAHWAMKESEKRMMDDPLLLDLVNLIAAGSGTNTSLVNAARRRRNALQHRGQRIAAGRIANSVSVVVASSSRFDIIATENLKSGEIKRQGQSEEVWCVLVQTRFPLADFRRLEICLAGFPISLMKSQEESRFYVSEKGEVTLKSDEGLFLGFTLLEGFSLCAAKSVVCQQDVGRIIQALQSGTTDMDHQQQTSRYFVSFKSVSFPFEKVRQRLETLGIFEL